MERRKFIKSCCYTTVGMPIIASTLSSCGAIYYATSVKKENSLVINKSEFKITKKDKTTERSYVFVETVELAFPICIQKTGGDEYSALLMSCTHRGCELNFGGGIYSCPCHGSEFSKMGEVLEGPADKNLRSFKTETDNENIYILLS
jgi:cytochrome b6-f complex iron-sulfur subunit